MYRMSLRVYLVSTHFSENKILIFHQITNNSLSESVLEHIHHDSMSMVTEDTSLLFMMVMNFYTHAYCMNVDIILIQNKCRQKESIPFLPILSETVLVCLSWNHSLPE